MIKYIYLISSIIACSSVCQSQTKQETEEWILSKLNMYSNAGFTVSVPKFNKSTKFYIIGGKLVMSQDYYPTTNIEIKDIQDYTFEIAESMNDSELGYFPETVIIKLYCRSGTNCVKAYSKEDNKLLMSLPYFKIYMDGDFKKDDLPNRLKKAFKDLISHHGGRFITESY